jgi:predicted Zn-dependent peptidase
LNYAKTVLPNGLTILTMPMPFVRSVCVSIFIAAGSRFESESEAGTAHFLEHIVFKGSEHWPTARHISEAVEGIGGLLNAGTGREMTMYWVKVAQPHVRLALDVLSDMLLRPLMDPTEVEKERQVIIEEISMLHDSPESQVQVNINNLYWSGHPLGREVIGNKESIEATTREGLWDYMGRHYGPARTVVSVAGAIEPAAILDAVSENFSAWRPAPSGAAVPYRDTQTAPRVDVEYKDTEQAHFCLALPGLPRNHPDQFALTMANTILGDGMSSRLFQEIRERHALAYSVDSSSIYLQDTGMVCVYAGVDPARMPGALNAVLGELARLREEPVTSDELKRACEFNKGRLLLQMENTSAVASWYGSQEAYPGRVYAVDEIVAGLEAVTRQDIQRVIRQAFQEKRANLAVVGPFDDAAPFSERLERPWV